MEEENTSRVRFLSDSSISSSLTLPHIFSDTSNEQDDAIHNFMGLLTACFMLTIISFFIWKKCLFEKYGAYLPIDKNIDAQQLKKRKVFMSTKTFSIFNSMFFPLLQKLDMDYWCTHCGVDGYLYMLFQRRFLSLTIYMSVVSIVSQIILFLVDKDYSFSVFGNQD